MDTPHRRPRGAPEVDPLDRGVRQDVRADLVDVLRLLVVTGLSGAFEQAADDRRRRAWNREERQAAGRVVQGGPEQDARPVLDHERERIDARAAVGHPGGQQRAACRHALRQHLEPGRRHVVDPRAEDVGAGKRATGEHVAARVDGDVVALLAREDNACDPDIEPVARGQHVRVDRRSGVSLHVVFVAGAEEPWLYQRARRGADDTAWTVWSWR